MLGLGWTEMLVIGVVALIVIGPKDLPVVMQKVGRFAGQLKRMGNEFQREINRTTGLDEVRNLRSTLTSPLKQTADEIRREFNKSTAAGVEPSGKIKPSQPGAESVVDEIREAAGMTPKPAAAIRNAAVRLKADEERAVREEMAAVSTSTVTRAELPAPAKKPAAASSEVVPVVPGDVAKAGTTGKAARKPARKAAAKPKSKAPAGGASTEAKPVDARLDAPKSPPAKRKVAVKPKAEPAAVDGRADASAVSEP